MEPCELVFTLLEAGLTQEQIAARSGVHQTTVSKLARGDIKDTLSRTYRALQALHQQVYHPNQAASSIPRGQAAMNNVAGV